MQEYRRADEHDAKFLRLFAAQDAKFQSILTDLQKRILSNAIKKKILLKYFLATLSQEQVSQFESITVEMRRKVEYQDILEQLHKQVPMT